MSARAAGLALAGWLAAFGPAAALAEIVKQVAIESSPPGAEVFLVEGTRKNSLGRTPLKAQLEFHSEISVLRLSLSKSGFQAQTVEVGARQSALKVKLLPQRLAAQPGEITNEALRGLQSRIGKRIDESVGRSVASATSLEWEFVGLIRVVDLDGKTYLLAPVALARPPQESAASVSDIWDKVRSTVVQPLGEVARGESSIEGIVVSVGLGQIRRDFGVGGQVESRLEMQCVPGTQMVQEYDPCARRVQVYETQRDGSTRNTGLTRCEGGTVTRSVFNPCATKTPVTKSAVVVKPQAGTRIEQAQIQFVVPAAALGEARKRRELPAQVGVLRADAQGRVLEKRGQVPSMLPRIP